MFRIIDNIVWGRPTVTVTPQNAIVTAGDDFTLTCHFDWEGDYRLLGLIWYHNPNYGTRSTRLWRWITSTDTDSSLSNKVKYIRVNTKSSNEHAIKVMDAESSDGGIYSCEVIFQRQNYHSVRKVGSLITIHGNYLDTIQSKT